MNFFDVASGNPSEAATSTRVNSANLTFRYGSLIASLKPGDADGDADVDFADLLALAKHYNIASGMKWSDGDFTSDGAVSFDDLLILAKNYGYGTAVPADTELPAAMAADWQLAQSLVPEPAAAGLLAWAGCVAVRRRRGRPC